MAATILFPTDFSEPANNALRYVLPFAQKLNARIVLLHVFSVPTPMAEAPFYTWEDDVKLQEENVMVELDAYEELIHQSHPELEVVKVASLGFPVPTILITAEEHEADWIIMGTKGATGLKKIFLGSIAAQVISRASIPVLAIPEADIYHGIHRIVYATNYENSEIDALQRLTKLATLFDAEILVAHVCTENEELHIKRWRKFEQQVRETVDYKKLTFKFIPHDDLCEGLEELLTYSRSEMLAMSPHKRSLLDRLFYPSRTKEMAYQTHTPLLAVPGD